MAELPDLKQQCKKNPYKFINSWMESILPHTGGKAFEVISLMPPSLILPDLPYHNKKVRSNINVLLLTPSGGGKSTIARQLGELSYSPLEVESITPAKLESEILANPLFTLIVGDFARLSRDPVIIKVVEGILGEEKRIQRSTMQKEIDQETDGVGLLCGTPNDLSDYLTGGLIFRLVPLIIFHNGQEHSDIGKQINMSIGSDGGVDDKENIIKEYYDELLSIQTGQHPDMNPILGYEIPDDFKDMAFSVWDKYTKEIQKRTKTPLNWFRELHEFFRFLIAHAFLNIHNRKVEDGILYPNEEDYKVAIKLMKRTIKIKFKLINLDSFSRSISSLKELAEVMESETVSSEDKQMLRNLIKVKRGKIARG